MISVNSIEVSEILGAAERMPGGAKLVVPQVGWDDFERLAAEIAERLHRQTTMRRRTLRSKSM